MPITLANLKYSNEAQTRIDMMVIIPDKFRGQPFPFTYDPNDRNEVAQLVKAELEAHPRTPAPYTPPPPRPVQTDDEKFDAWVTKTSRIIDITPAEFVNQLKRILA